MTEQLLTPDEAAAYLRVAPHTLAQWLSKGVGPPYRKVGPRLVRYDRTELESWLQAQASPAPPGRLEQPPCPFWSDSGGPSIPLPPRRRARVGVGAAALRTRLSGA